MRNRLMWIKSYMQRSLTYLSLLNSGMILFLFLGKLKEIGYISFDLKIYVIPLFLGTLLILCFIGWIEVRFLKGWQTEAEISFNLSPPFKEMKRKIDLIYNKLDIEEGTHLMQKEKVQ